MNVLLIAEKELNVDLVFITENLNKICSGLKFVNSDLELKIESEHISHPNSYYFLNKSIVQETEKYDFSFLFTEKRYDNNYFFETFGDMVIISFSGWDYLTSLSKNNGIVYFIADLLALKIDNSDRHDNITGCIYDFAWNKTAIDLGMRNAFICPSCLTRISSKKLSNEKKKQFEDLKEILNILGNTSKWNRDITEFFKSNSQKQIEKKEYGVFLAHNSEDKSQVKAISDELKKRNIKPWLDSEQIPPGRFFQDVIQETITKISSVAVFIGEHGLGRWQGIELKSFITQCINRDIPVIPVLLPNVDKLPDELIFLGEFNWVKFKTDINDEEAIDNLIWGITGQHPKR